MVDLKEKIIKYKRLKTRKRCFGCVNLKRLCITREFERRNCTSVPHLKVYAEQYIRSRNLTWKYNI